MATVWIDPSFISSEGSDVYVVIDLSITVCALTMHFIIISIDSNMTRSSCVILRTGTVVENMRAHRLSSIIEKCHEPSACEQNDL